MSDTSDVHDQAVELVERTTAAQGLPVVIEDEAVLGHVATLAGEHDRAAA